LSKPKELTKDDIKSNIDLLMTDYRLLEDKANFYFGYLSNIMNFTFILFAAILTVVGGYIKFTSENIWVLTLISLYVLPVCCYVFGLFYVQIVLMLYRLGAKKYTLEQNIKALSDKLGYTKLIIMWDGLAKATNTSTGAKLPYGTMTMFYILVPLACCILFNIWLSSVNAFANLNFIIFTVIPAICYLVYISFTVSLIKKIVKTEEECHDATKKIKG